MLRACQRLEATLASAPFTVLLGAPSSGKTACWQLALKRERLGVEEGGKVATLHHVRTRGHVW